MPLRKPDPERYCEVCGNRLARNRYDNGVLESVAHFATRRFCDRACRDAGHIDPDTTNRQTMHARARKHRKDACERCGSTERLEVHHRDRDRTNNDLANLETLCSPCHHADHGVEPMLAARRARALCPISHKTHTE